MNQKLQNILEIIQQSEKLDTEQKANLIKAIKDADKELEITTFKLERTEKVKKTTAILLEETIEELEQKRKAVEAQNRELEIETALEKVRSSALAMKEPSDMVDVCGIISDQLQLLKVKDIRNIQTAIINEEKGIYQNYEYFTQYKTTSTLEIEIKLHPTVVEFVNEIQKSNDAFFTKTFEGEALQDWREYRRKTNQNADPILDEATSVHYYFYSIGPGALGISTYAPLNEENIAVFRRFRNVFELAYRRFIDIEQAIAQAREAQIEAALERVRSRTMGMWHSDELREVVAELYQELEKLDFNIRQCVITILDKNTETVQWWSTGFEEKILPKSYIISYKDPKIYERLSVQSFIDAIDNKVPFRVTELSGENKRQFDQVLLEYTDLKNLPDSVKAGMMEISKLFISDAFMKHGVLEVVGTEPLPDEKVKTLQRFAVVFEQTYTRFLDLQKAEGQAREAQIELALERVRAKTMSMHKSEELAGAASVVFEQLTELGVQHLASGFTIIDKEKPFGQMWLSYQGDMNPKPLPLDFNASPILKRVYDSWKEGNSHYVNLISGEQFVQHMQFLKKLFGERVEKFIVATNQLYIDAGKAVPDQMVMQHTFFSNGSLILNNITQIKEQDILNRFAKVFDQTYTRFLDLQKAEAQAREAKIEAALERVRARTMAMHKSDELADVVGLLYKQLEELNFGLEQVLIAIVDKDRHVVEWWSRGFGIEIIPERYLIPIVDHPFLKQWLSTWESGSDYSVYNLKGEIKRTYDEYLFTSTDLKYFSPEVQLAMRSMESIYLCDAYIKHGSIQAAGPAPLTDEQAQILKRFATVLNQTYTRLFDLQKAEAQAREAQIEAALERVRSRSMGMQKSEELAEVSKVMNDQMQALNPNIFAAGFVMDYKETNDFNFWIARSNQLFSDKYHIPYFDHPIFNNFVEAKEKGSELFSLSIGFDEKNRWVDHAGNHLPDIPQEMKEFLYNSPGYSNANVVMQNFILFIESYTGIPFSDEDQLTLKRFGKVFEQSYTRFLDLQKAEAQAREAKIEAALERTRTQSMIMQHSKELDDTLRVFHEQVLLLGINSEFSYLWLPDEDKERHIFWAAWAENLPAGRTGKNGSTVFKSKAIDYPLDGNDPATALCLTDWKSNVPIHSYYLQPAEVENYFASWKELFVGVERLKPENFLRGLYYVEAYMKYGCFGVMIDSELSEDEKKILGRFSIEFERTYTRFLDLKKAEEQAREAKIEAALENVRSRSLAMHKSDEIKNVVVTVMDKMNELKIEMNGGVSLATFIEGSQDLLHWYVNPSHVDGPVTMHLAYFDNILFHDFVKARKEGKELLPVVYSFEQKNEYFEHTFEHSDFKIIPEELKKWILEQPYFGYSVAIQKHSAIFFNDYTGKLFSEKENEILIRFAKVFDQAYIRFLDLQKAELLAKEAIKQASLDRVRGEIASMRSAEDLNRITPIIWRELKTLDVPFIRCGVFIVDEENANVQVYLTTPDGRSLAVLNLPVDANELTSNAVEYWRKGIVYTEHWNREEFINWTKSMIEQGQIQNAETYQGSANPPESLDLHFVPFTQGMLYVGNTSSLTEEKIQLVKSLAEAFSIAYARYEDFKKLEDAKNKVEVTLKELKSAQVQLIHSEKMASLGELTAGIAHEIKNPLNFVNNFSDLSAELIDEVKEELKNNNNEEVLALLEDLKQNLEKINQHGKRADSIVKGMLLHSRGSSGEKTLTDINDLLDQYVNLAYHGMRAQNKEFNISIEKDYDKTLEKVNVIPQDLSRVFLNIINNACYAAYDRKKKSRDNFSPMLKVSTKNLKDKIEIRIVDNGNGIPKDILDKIFQPFFTTKPTGEGTGLGLSLSYDIVKAHGGEINVNSKDGQGTEFIITLNQNL